MQKVIVVPTKNLADLVIRAVNAKRVPYNYCASWVDARGYGLSLAKVEWLQEGQLYINDYRR